MRAVVAWFRLDARRRWRSLLVLALLIALATGTVLTAVTGATRGSNAIDRLLDRTLPATVEVGVQQAGFDWDAVRARPDVEALGTMVRSGFEVDGRPVVEFFIPTPADAEVMRSIERVVVLEGRLADPGRADEVVITPAFERTNGKGVGDTVALGLYTPEQIDTLQYPMPSTSVGAFTFEQIDAALAAGVDPDNVEPAAGPVVQATIVGVVRSLFFSERTRDEPGFVIPSAGLVVEYEQNLLGAERLAPVGALVRLTGGQEAIPAFQESLAGVPAQFLDPGAATVARLKQVTGFEANSLYVFAAVAGSAAVILVGLAIARLAAATVTGLLAMRAVGMTPSQTRRAAAAGPAVAAVAGVTLGAVGAVLASRWFPIGAAALVEPSPGPHADIVVLAVALLGVPLLVTAGAYAAAALAGRTPGPARSPRRSAVVTAAAGAGLPVPAVVGARFALEPGEGQRAVPVRPALAGTVIGVLGVLAAVTFSSAVNDVVAHPARSGVVYDVEAWFGLHDVSFGEATAAEVFGVIADVPGVSGVDNNRHTLAESAGNELMVSTFDPLGRPLDYVVPDGRLPVALTEVMLGRQSADEMGVGVGDTITVTGTDGTADLVVVGVGLIAPQHWQHGTGALVTPAGYDSLFAGFGGQVGYVGLEPGVDPEEIIPRMYEAVEAIPGAVVGLLPLDWLPEIEEIRYVQLVPLFLAGFLALLALGAVGHALATAIRRRRGEVAVLRALGMTPGQSHRVVLTQATVTALVGLVVGVPLGVALGRTVWRYVADAMYYHYVPPVARLALILVVPVAVLAAVLLAAWPGCRAASMPVADVLRTE